MATGTSWLVDGKRFASKIKSASSNPEATIWKSNPSKPCPNCHHVIDNNDVTQEWPGLPKGVKFDPTDQEIVWHLLAKVGAGGFKPHPFIDAFIPTVDNDDGICYTHPQNLPGVSQDGIVSHFFHRAIKAYNTGTRKRRKIQGDDLGDVRWHKTGRTKPVILDGVQRGCKKIMVLYMSSVRGGKADKTNWVMHQYHLGTGEDENEGDYIVSKIFYQQQSTGKGDKIEDVLFENVDTMMAKVDPVTPNSVTPEPPRPERRCAEFDLGNKSTVLNIVTGTTEPEMEQAEIHVQPECGEGNCDGQLHTVTEHLEIQVQSECENTDNDHQMKVENTNDIVGNNDTSMDDAQKSWWDSESQNLLDSQQLAEGLSLCDELLRSQSPDRCGNGNEKANSKPCLSDYGKLGAESFKKDLEECQNLVLDPANIELDTPPDFRLSQLEFGSQDSFIAWGGGKMIGKE